MLNLRFDVPFFERGKFPTSVANASQEIILPNPWAGRGNSAPFDQRMCNSRNAPSKNDFFPLTAFYLILDVAVGGTNGWFPDGAGNKPWLNGAISGFLLVNLGVRDGSSPTIPDAMQLFAQAQDKWSETWPESEDDRAMRMYVFRHFYVCELR